MEPADTRNAPELEVYCDASQNLEAGYGGR